MIFVFTNIMVIYNIVIKPKATITIVEPIFYKNEIFCFSKLISCNILSFWLKYIVNSYYISFNSYIFSVVFSKSFEVNALLSKPNLWLCFKSNVIFMLYVSKLSTQKK